MSFKEMCDDVLHYNEVMKRNSEVLPDNHELRFDFYKFNEEQLYRPRMIWIEYNTLPNIKIRVVGHVISIEYNTVGVDVKLWTKNNEAILVHLYSNYAMQFGDYIQPEEELPPIFTF